MDKPRLLKVVIFHSLFSGFGEIQAVLINYLSAPVRQFLSRSLQRRWGLEPESFEIVYSGIASTFFIGVFCGGLSMAYCMERFGRKGTAVYVRCTLGILSASAMLMAKWLDLAELFVLGHFLAGVLTTLKVVLFIYMAECAPKNSRGWSMTALGSGHNLMLLLISPLCLPGVFGNDRQWWLLPAVCLLLSMTHLFVASYFPESPKHLFIGKGQKGQAADAVRFYHGTSANLVEIFEEFESERLVVHRERVGLREFCVSRRLRWSLGLIYIVSFLPAFSLTSIKSQYLESILMRYGLGQSPAMVSTMVMTAIGAPFSLLAPFMVEFKGRRPLFLVVSALSTLELGLMTLAQAFFDLSGNGGWLIVGIALLACTFGQISCSLGIFNMNPILVGELIPTSARAKATQISQMPPMLLVLLIVLVFPSAVASFGALFLLPLFLLSLLFMAFMWHWLPETKGLPVDEIFRNLADSRTPSPKSSSYSMENYGTMEERGESSKLVA